MVFAFPLETSMWSTWRQSINLLKGCTDSVQRCIHGFTVLNWKCRVCFSNIVLLYRYSPVRMKINFRIRLIYIFIFFSCVQNGKQEHLRSEVRLTSNVWIFWIWLTVFHSTIFSTGTESPQHCSSYLVFCSNGWLSCVLLPAARVLKLYFILSWPYLSVFLA